MSWDLWWIEAQVNAEMARILFRRRFYSGALYHALMAVETGAKAVIIAPARIDDLGDTTIDDLGDFAIDDLGGQTPRPKHRLDELLRQIPGKTRALRGCEAKLIALERVVGVPDLYLASRYPNAWPAGTRAPSQMITRQHAKQALDAMEDLLEEGRSRFGQ